jgi:hypothetical protein
MRVSRILVLAIWIFTSSMPIRSATGTDGTPIKFGVVTVMPWLVDLTAEEGFLSARNVHGVMWHIILKHHTDGILAAEPRARAARIHSSSRGYIYWVDRSEHVVLRDLQTNSSDRFPPGWGPEVTKARQVRGVRRSVWVLTETGDIYQLREKVRRMVPVYVGHSCRAIELSTRGSLFALTAQGVLQMDAPSGPQLVVPVAKARAFALGIPGTFYILTQDGAVERRSGNDTRRLTTPLGESAPCLEMVASGSRAYGRLQNGAIVYTDGDSGSLESLRVDPAVVQIAASGSRLYLRRSDGIILEADMEGIKRRAPLTNPTPVSRISLTIGASLLESEVAPHSRNATTPPRVPER